MLGDNDPRGTVKELETLGVDLSKIASCSKRVIEDNQIVVRGCHEWKRCNLKERGVSGPVHKGLQTLKKRPNGDPIVQNMIMTCHYIPGYRKGIELNGGVVNVIATEGETIEMRGTKVRDEIIPGQGAVRIHDEGVYPEEIKKFPRPGQPGNLIDQVLVAKIMKEFRQREADERPAKILGLKGEHERATEKA